MDSVEKGILATLNYSDIFDFPLRVEELNKYLISDLPISKESITGALKVLVYDRKIIEKGGYLFINGRDRIVELRSNRERDSAKKVAEIAWVIKLISHLPWIRMVAVTGDLAYGNGGKDSDVDLMVITSPNRMWLTRFLVFSFLEILGLKRRDAKREPRGKICINVWCDEENLSIFPEDYDLVIASDIVHTIPLVNKGLTYERFIQSNLWVKNYFSNWSL